MNQQALSELAKVKAIFQQRAICAALGINDGTVADVAIDASGGLDTTTSTNKESE